QTQPFISIKGDGNPSQIWGPPGGSDQVKDANGNTVQGRNQYTITPAQKVWLQDTWFATPDWTFVGGLAYQYVERKGDNRGSLYNAP
ncbi:TonB-dependent receptor, partial [Klebsiella pneumoniae]|nr:TonB-dependent receptor [Klebsiella pneumoniae]